MQEALSADFADRTDLNRSVQRSSDDLASQYGPHSRRTALFNSRLQIHARQSIVRVVSGSLASL